MGDYVVDLLKRPTLLQLFGKPSVKGSNLFTLKPGTHIWRCGTEVVEAKATRRGSETRLVGQGKRLPTFFAPAHVAVMYGSASNPTAPLSRWTLTEGEPLHILVLKRDTIDDIFTSLWKSSSDYSENAVEHAKDVHERMIQEDREKLKQLFYIFGYIPYDEDTEEYMECLKELKKMILDALKDEPSLKLLPEYSKLLSSVEVSSSFEPVTKKRKQTKRDLQVEFNRNLGIAENNNNLRGGGAGPMLRFSSSSVDYTAMNDFLKGPYHSTKLNKFIDTIDGIYVEPTNSGFYNKYNFLTLMNEFHEELFLRPKFIGYGEDARIRPTKLIQLPLTLQDAFRVSGLKVQENGKIDPSTGEPIFKKVEDSIEQPYGDMEDGVLPPICSYIYSFQQTYSEIAAKVESILLEIDVSIQTIQSEIDTLNIKGATTQQLKGVSKWLNLTQGYPYNDKVGLWIREHLTLLKQNFFNILKAVYMTLVSSFTINPQLFIGKVSPHFEDEKTFKEDLYFFTCLSDTLKAYIREITKLFSSLGLKQFIPVASGGILFSQYTFGDYRRETKDIDLKIIDTTGEDLTTADMIVNNDKSRLEKLEEVYTKLSFTISIFGYIQESIFNQIGVERIYKITEIYSSKSELVSKALCHRINVSDCKKLREGLFKSVNFYIGYGTNYLYDIDTLTESILYRYDKKYHEMDDAAPIRGELFYGSFDNFLKENSDIKSVSDFKKVRDDAIVKRKTGIEEKSDVQVRNAKQALLDTEKLFNKWLEGLLGEEYANQIIKVRNYLYILNASRPNLNPYSDGKKGIPYRVGNFSSLWVSIHSLGSAKNVRKYGLIDYTFDSDYALATTYTYPTGQKHQSLTKGYGDGIYYASFYNFLINTFKLKYICDANYYGDPDDRILKGMNRLNKCAPNLENAQQKRIKYNERHDLLLKFCNEILGSTLTKLIKNGDLIIRDAKKEDDIFKTVKSLKEYYKMLQDLYMTKQYSNSIIPYMNNTGNVRMNQDRPFSDKLLSIFIARAAYTERAKNVMIGAGSAGGRSPLKSRRVSKKTRGISIPRRRRTRRSTP